MELFYGVLALASVVCVHLIFRSLRPSQKLQKLRKLPGYRTRFLIGNLYDLGFLKLRDRKRFISDIYYGRFAASSMFHKEGLYTIWLGPMPLVFITRAKTAEVILSSSVMIEKPMLYNILADFLGTGLFVSTGDKWRQDRRSIAPAFHSRVLEDFLDRMNDHSRILVDVLKRKSEGSKWFDPLEAVSSSILDILMDTMLDFHVKAQMGSSGYVNLVDRIVAMISKRMYSPWFYSNIYYLFPEGRKFWKLMQYLNGLIDKKIKEKISEKKEREKSGTGPKRRIILDVLLEQQMTLKELRDHINTFMFAGHSALSYYLCWLLYLLGVHKHVQSKLFNEICEVFPGGAVENVTKDNLNALTYTDCVMKECHRLYTSIPEFGRRLTEDTVIGGYNVPAGTDCIISIACIHRDPDVYPEPERFDPDRFLPENSVGRSPYAFIPYGAGLRNCIGQRYAHMKMKVILCHIISKLTVHSMDPEDKVLQVPEIAIKPMDPLRIVFEPRQFST